MNTQFFISSSVHGLTGNAQTTTLSADDTLIHAAKTAQLALIVKRLTTKRALCLSQWLLNKASHKKKETMDQINIYELNID